MRTFFHLSTAVALLAAQSILAGPLSQATVTKVINDVRVIDPAKGNHPASIDEVIKNEVGLQTGIKSRSELLFPDDTLTRIGPETYFSFKTGTRVLTLERGTMLLQVPKGLGGTQIRTAAVTASITGTTILVEHKPKRDIKVLVLEGSLRLAKNGTIGDSVLLTAGKMVIMPPNARRVPDPVTVDISKVIKTSSLINMKGRKNAGLPPKSAAAVNREVQAQKRAMGKNLLATNLVIDGAGTKVTLATDAFLAALQTRTNAAPFIPTRTLTLPGGDVGPAPTIKQDGEPYDDLQTQVRYGDDGKPVSQPIVLNNPQDWSKERGGGSIRIVSNDSVTVNSTLKVSDVATDHEGAQISIDSRKATGVAIDISSSAQLLALLDAASHKQTKMTLKSSGGDINVAGTIHADNGAVEIRNDGANGVINLTAATLHGDTIKIGALGANGTLNVGGGVIDANTTIKLYAGGSNGTVNFVDDVTLSGNSVKTIAADTVTIFNGKTVTVLGNAPVGVFTNNPNYTGFGGNGSTTGTFAGQGATTHVLNGAPGY